MQEITNANICKHSGKTGQQVACFLKATAGVYRYLAPQNVVLPKHHYVGESSSSVGTITLSF